VVELLVAETKLVEQQLVERLVERLVEQLVAAEQQLAALVQQEV
jgi:hypothetical protein